MSEELAETNQGGGFVVPQNKHDETAMSAVSAGGKFLPRLQLMTSRSEQCEINGFPTNHFAVVESNDYQDIGESVDILIISWRPKALDTKAEDGVISCYDPKFVDGKPTGVFAEIQKKSEGKDSGCMYGPEYLVFIPSLDLFATFFCGSKTLRYEVPQFKKRIGGAATLRPHMIHIKKGDRKYFSTKVYDCTTPLDVPEQTRITEEAEKFLNPPAQTTEAASDEETAATSRAQ
jgi:hypothetical protein